MILVLNKFMMFLREEIKKICVLFMFLDKETVLSPVVQCGPPDITFAKPLILSLPHCAVIDTPEKWTISIYNSNTPSAEEEMPEWKVCKKMFS